jgi:uncharacterized membrane protein YkgB
MCTNQVLAAIMQSNLANIVSLSLSLSLGLTVVILTALWHLFLSNFYYRYYCSIVTAVDIVTQSFLLLLPSLL